MVRELRRQGFGGVTVDRSGYGDSGREIESTLRIATGSEPTVGPDGRIAFFRIDPRSAEDVIATRKDD